jgi:hypothetical protein
LHPNRFTIPSGQFNRRNFHGKDIFIERHGGAAVGVCADAADSRGRRDGSDHVQRRNHLQRHRQGCMQRPRWCPEGRPDIDDDSCSGSGSSAGRTGEWPNHLQGRHELVCHGQGCVQRSWRCAKSEHFGGPAHRCGSGPRSRTCTGDNRREVDSDRYKVGADGDGRQHRPDGCDGQVQGRNLLKVAAPQWDLLEPRRRRRMVDRPSVAELFITGLTSTRAAAGGACRRHRSGSVRSADS